MDAKLKELEEQRARGEGNFARAMEIAALHYTRDATQAAKDHPVMATLAGAASGGVSGYMGGPQVYDTITKTIPNIMRNRRVIKQQ